MESWQVILYKIIFVILYFYGVCLNTRLISLMDVENLYQNFVWEVMKNLDL